MKHRHKWEEITSWDGSCNTFTLYWCNICGTLRYAKEDEYDALLYTYGYRKPLLFKERKITTANKRRPK